MAGDEPAVMPDRVIEWLAGHAVPLAHVEAGNEFADLQPLKQAIGDARLVGLGEATHGSREFFQMKHRLFEFLVSELGFDAFLLEASYAACHNIDRYVMTGEGDRAAALASQGFWTWDTEEVSDLIDWLHDWNREQDADQKVRFLGYDCQRVNDAITLLRGFLGKVAPDLLPSWEPAFTTLWVDDVAIPSSFNSGDSLRRAQTFTALHELIGYLTLHRLRLSRLTSPREWSGALEHAKNMTRFIAAYGMAGSEYGASFASRDLSMAETIEEIVEELGPDARAAVWAHNGHVSTAPFLEGVTTMGGHLRAAYGSDYYTIGFAFNEGAFQSREMGGDFQHAGPLREFTVGPAPDGYVEWYFAQAGLGPCFVDFRHDRPDWLDVPMATRSIGAGFSSEDEQSAHFTARHPLSQYDGLIYIPTTTRARPTPTGQRS